ncbi:MAG TPA: GNAT family N-acetyltransferase [Xanthomarina sp.]|nr:GNAT family N-acetyltransferase [Xanthomarina sp.]
MIVAETNRLLITKFTENDATFFYKLAKSPNWIRYIGDRGLKTVTDAQLYLKEDTLKSYTEFGFGFYKLQLKENGELIGTSGLVKRDWLEYVDIGFALLPEYEGKGFGFEASEEILKLAKNQFHLNKILAITLPTNKKSVKLIEKLGLVFEKRVKPFEDDEELLLFAKTL